MYVFHLLFLDNMYLSRIRFLAEKDRLKTFLFVAVIANSASSWAILPVVALASTPKVETVLHRGSSWRFFFKVVYCLYWRINGWNRIFICRSVSRLVCHSVLWRWWGQDRCYHIVPAEEERRLPSSKHKLTRGLFRMSELSIPASNA